MPAEGRTTPVVDSVPKINNELAVGSDLEFQRRWKKMERGVWALLAVFLVCSFAGVFGRGPLAKAEVQAPDGSFHVRYERIQRFGTPSVISIQFEPAAVRNGKIQLWVNEKLIRPLGNQRVLPQPSESLLQSGGILYTFPVTQGPAEIEFQTQPSGLGSSELILRVPGKAEVRCGIFVMP
jgi:hypothetical protein